KLYFIFIFLYFMWLGHFTFSFIHNVTSMCSISCVSAACSNAATDVVFLIDGSKSVRPENFELVKKWINQIIDKLDVSDSKAHVALVQYSSAVKQEFPLGRYNNKKDLKDAVKKMAYMERGTMTGQALRFMTDFSFTQGARPGVTKVGIVFTDGRSQDYIGDAAKKAKELGIKMYAVGVGNAVEDELKEIASEPIGEHYFYTADFKTMTQIGKKLQINICKGLRDALSITTCFPCKNVILIDLDKCPRAQLNEAAATTS
uniref:VWFA domain-containing protein n=1 Tax=Periophthalmus magnuspinnatus TaxID=409849 RepID=A0A3B3ZQQ2_9GOBI